MPLPAIQPYTQVFRAQGTFRVRRTRQPVSCVACQRRKSKCDRQKPCGACVKRNEGAACHISPVSSSPTSGSIGSGKENAILARKGGEAGGAGGRREVQARLNKLEDLVRELAQGADSSALPQRVEERSGSVRRNLVPNRLGGEGDEEAKLEGAALAYAGPLSWTALIDNIHDIQDILSGEDDEDITPEEMEENRTSDVIIGEGPKITIQDVISALPPKQDVDRLVFAYFNAKFLAVPFLHTHYFRRTYERFWEDPYSPHTSLLWVSILFSVLSIGTFITKIKNPSSLAPPSAAVDPRVFMMLAARCLVAGEYLRGSQHSVEAILIHAHSRSIQKEDSDSTVFTLYGLAARMAQRRGYHRDPTKVSARITPFEAEMRRRTWFLISTSDTLLSFQQGLPPIIHGDLCDVGHPTNITDDDFDEDSLMLPASRPRQDPLPMLAYTLKSTLAVTLRRIIHHILKVTPDTSTNTYTATLALHSELAAWHDAIPACLCILPIATTPFTDPSYTIMHRIMLEVMCRKAMCILHRPYLSAEGAGSARDKYRFSREVCRDSALRLMNIHVELHAAIQPGGRLYEDRYMVNSLTLTEFLVAAMIICVDLNESVDLSPETRQSRLSTLGTAYQIWSSRASESKDALRASKVLRAFLSRLEDTQSQPQPQEVPEGMGQERGQTNGREESSSSSSSATVPIDGLGADDMQLDDFFGNQEILDWTTIDEYLRQDAFEQQPQVCGLWGTSMPAPRN